MALQMNVSGIRRNIKNIAHNYTDAQVKVREATSNDPWGPSSTLMSEIADLTYNVVAFTEIMQMIWKRLNDHGRNWRHVYKALVLLEYLIKTGSEKVSEQCRENIYAIQTLKDFQFLEENKDMGLNVREKAKTLVSLLRDEERLLNERVRALKAKKRFAQSVSGIGSETRKYDAEELTIINDDGKDINSPSSPSYGDTYVTSSLRSDREAFGISDRDRDIPSSELENARPQTIGEEELQLQLALAMSKEEADQEEAKKKSDDVRLQMALNQSEVDSSPLQGQSPMTIAGRDQERRRKDDSSLNDLLDINFNPNGQAKNFVPPTDPWGLQIAGAVPTPLAICAPQCSSNDELFSREICTLTANDPWTSPSSAPSSRVTSPPTTDPWRPVASRTPELPVVESIFPETKPDPWAPVAAPQPADPWAPVSKVEPDPFAPLPPSNGRDVDEFAVLSTREKPSKNGSIDPLNLVGLDDALPSIDSRPKSKSPAAFLGENSNLVNLDNLVSAKAQAPPINSGNEWNDTARMGSSSLSFPTDFHSTKPRSSTTPTNPFARPTYDSTFVTDVNPFNSTTTPNPFQAQQPPKPSMNQLRTPGFQPDESPFKDPFTL